MIEDSLKTIRKLVINNQLSLISMSINKLNINPALEHEITVRLNDIVEILKNTQGVNK